MARAVKFDPPREDVPVWFMTYSDVITLLMTFFILLLTFATTEPESFERIQASMFGGGGGSGVAGEIDGAQEHDAIISRIRPRAARVTQRGSENPPIDTDTTLESLSKGLRSLDEEPEHDVMESQEFRTDLMLLVDQNEVTPLGKQRLQMMARQLQTGPFELTFRVYRERDLSAVYALVEYLDSLGVAPQATAIELQPVSLRNETSLAIRWLRRTGE